jgi:hypothetical protein
MLVSAHLDKGAWLSSKERSDQRRHLNGRFPTRQFPAGATSGICSSGSVREAKKIRLDGGWIWWMSAVVTVDIYIVSACKSCSDSPLTFSRVISQPHIFGDQHTRSLLFHTLHIVAHAVAFLFVPRPFTLALSLVSQADLGATP